jgi:aminopeptidase N
LHNLANSTTHHLWQFSKFGRDNIRKLLKDPKYRAAFEELLPKLNENEKSQLNRLLVEK